MFSGTADNIAHENEMISLLELVSFDGVETIDLGEEGMRMREKVVCEFIEMLFEKLIFVVGDALEHVAVVIGEEEELPTLPSLALHQLIDLIMIGQQVE